MKTIIAVGGDGTINEVVNGFFEGERPIASDAAFAIIPSGTGSDFVRTLNLPIDPKRAADVILRGITKSIDLAKLRYTALSGAAASRYFINVTSFGMGGAVAANAKRYSNILGGKLGFLTSTIGTLLRFRGDDVAIRLDGSQAIVAKITNVAIGNGQFHGGGMRVCPRARVDDGVLDISVIRHLSIFEVVKSISMLYNGKIYEHPKVQHHRAGRVSAEGNLNVLIEVDGEPLGRLPLEIEIVPSSIRVFS